MTYPVANEEQEIDAALRAAAYCRWMELRERRKPSDAERHDWIRALLMGEELRSLDGDVLSGPDRPPGLEPASPAVPAAAQE